MPVCPFTSLFLLPPRWLPSLGFVQTQFFSSGLLLTFVYLTSSPLRDSASLLRASQTLREDLVTWFCFRASVWSFFNMLRNAEAFALYTTCSLASFSILFTPRGDWPLWVPSIGSLALWLLAGFSQWRELEKDRKAIGRHQSIYFLGSFSLFEIYFYLFVWLCLVLVVACRT